GTAVILEEADHWIGVDLVAGRSQKARPVITTEIVSMRGYYACAVEDIRTRGASLQNRILDLERCVTTAVAYTPAAKLSGVPADRAVGDRQGTVVQDAAIATGS